MFQFSRINHYHFEKCLLVIHFDFDFTSDKLKVFLDTTILKI